MRKTFNLPIKGLSINSTYYGDRKHGMTAEAKEWFHTVFHVLSKPDNVKALSDLRTAFQPKKHAYFFQIKSTIPKEIYYTKDGKLSRRAFDITNVEKSIVDAFCLEKYAQKPYPYGCQNLQTDDCVVKGVLSVKVPGDAWNIQVTIRIVKN
jgi:hypothetical protein